MPLNKEAYLRYTIIDRCLNDQQRPYPSMEELVQACCDELGKRFSVSTIQKDIQDMKEDAVLGFHAPIRYSRRYKGYYYEQPGFSIRRLALQPQDVQALRNALDFLQAYSFSPSLGNGFRHAITKALAATQEAVPEKGRRHSVLRADYAPNQKGLEHLDFFLNAAHDETPVSFVHYSYNYRRFKAVVVHPYLIREFGNNWYLVGHSERHGQLRTFGFDRIYDPRPLQRAFIAPDEDELDQYLRHVYGVYPLEGHTLEEIRFLASPILSDYLHAHPIHASMQRVEESADGFGIFTLQLIPSLELINWFLSQAPQVRVLQPTWLREELNDLHRKAIADAP